MTLYREFLTDDRPFASYGDLKARFSLKAPDSFNFAYDVVDRYPLLESGKRALVWCNDEGEKRTWTFEEISDDSKRAALFFSSLGIKKGDTVMLILRRRYEWWPCMLALHRIGAVAVPATDQLLSADLSYRASAAGIKMIVACGNPAVQREIEKAAKSSPTVKSLVTVEGFRDGWIDFHKELSRFPPEFPRPSGEGAVAGRDPMLLYFTSGTSGNPKMVVHNGFYPLGHIITALFWQGVEDNGLHFTISETGWAKAVWGKLYGQWLCGSAVFEYDKHSFNPDRTLHLLSRHGITTFCAPPVIYRYFVRQDLSRYDLGGVRRFTSAGEALDGEVYNKFLEQTGKKIYEAYGQTESTVICANFTGEPVKPGSMGRPSPAYDVFIADGQGREVPRGTCGEISVRLPAGEKPCGLLSGYFRDAPLTKRAFEGGVYRTGDNAYMDGDGYVWFAGRADDMIKSSGFRISPFEVESVLLRHPAVMECAVTGVPDKTRGQAIKATIVLVPGRKPSRALEMEIAAFVKRRTALYKCPRVIEFVPSLPKTLSGKIRRSEIREKDREKTAKKPEEAL